MVEPRHPLQRGELQGLGRFPRRAAVDQFRRSAASLPPTSFTPSFRTAIPASPSDETSPNVHRPIRRPNHKGMGRSIIL